MDKKMKLTVIDREGVGHVFVDAIWRRDDLGVLTINNKANGVIASFRDWGSVIESEVKDNTYIPDVTQEQIDAFFKRMKEEAAEKVLNQ